MKKEALFIYLCGFIILMPLINAENPNCLQSGVCFSKKIFLFVEDANDSFTKSNLEGVGTNDDYVLKWYSQHVSNPANFLVVFKDWKTYGPTYSRTINRHIRGIGETDIESSDYNWNLKQYISMSDIKILNDEELYDSQLTTLSHEIGHHWLVYPAQPLDSGIQISDGIHYKDCIKFNKGDYYDPMQGSFNWEQIGPNEFISPEPSSLHSKDAKFSTLSLYLMGLLPKEAVEPISIILPENNSDNSYCSSSFYGSDMHYHINGTLKNITINDLIKVYGERRPSFENSSKIFTMQFAIIVHEDSNITQEDVNKLEKFIDEFSEYFSFVTSNTTEIIIFEPALCPSSFMNCTNSDPSVRICVDPDGVDYSTERIPYPINEQNAPNLFKKGYVFLNLSSEVFFKYDFCKDNSDLMEYYCINKSQLGSASITCPYGCLNGACLSKPNQQGNSYQINIKRGWNLISGLSFGMDQSSPATTTCKGLNLFSYFPFERTYGKYILDQTGTGMPVGVRKQDRTLLDKYNDLSQKYFISTEANGWWAYSGSDCSFSGIIRSNFSTSEVINRLHNYDIKLVKGWNFLSITPDMIEHGINDFSGTCKITMAYFFNSEGQNWETVGDRVFQKADLTRGMVVKTGYECVLGFQESLPPLFPPS